MAENRGTDGKIKEHPSTTAGAPLQVTTDLPQPRRRGDHRENPEPNTEQQSEGKLPADGNPEHQQHQRELDQPGSSTKASTDPRSKKMSNSTQSSRGSLPNDTQPNSPWVYETFANQVRSSPARQGGMEKGDEGLSASFPPDHTLEEGDTGHIDLMKAFEPESMDDEDGEDQNGYSDFMDDESQSRAELFPESKRFPQTPATAGRKRNHRGETLSELTPSLPVNPFGPNAARPGEGGIMGLSQLFNNTQAPTSPFEPGLSESLSERPSPDMYYNHNGTAEGIPSSPVKVASVHFKRNGPEPMTRYVSILESQEERERQEEIRRARETSVDDYGSSDDGFSQESSGVIRRRKRQKIDEDTTRILAGITAPGRPGSREGGDKRSPHNVLNREVRSGGTSRRATVIISDDTPRKNDTGDDTASEGDEIGDGVAIANSQDDDYSSHLSTRKIQVPMTSVKRFHQGRSSTSKISEQSPSLIRQGHLHGVKLNGSSKAAIALQNASSFEDSQGSGDKMDILIGTQSFAVDDSQPSLPPPLGSGPEVLQPPETPGPVSSAPAGLSLSQSQPQLMSTVARAEFAAHIEIPDPESSSLPAPPDYLQPDMATIRESPVAQSEYVMSNGPPEGQDLQIGLAANDSAQDFMDAESGLQMVQKRNELPSTDSEVGKNSDKNEEITLPDLVNDTSTPHQQKSLKAQSASSIPETSPSAGIQSSQPAVAAESGSLVQRNNELTNSLVVPALLDSNTESTKEHSTTSAHFETAQTHLNSSGEAILPNSSRLRQGCTTPKSTRVRSIAEIAADPTSPDIGRSVDVNMNLITSQDVEYEAAIDGSSPIGPSRKRRRLTDRNLHIIAEQESNNLPSDLVVSNEPDEDKQIQKPPQTKESLQLPEEQEPAIVQPKQSSKSKKPAKMIKYKSARTKWLEKEHRTSPSRPRLDRSTPEADEGVSEAPQTSKASQENKTGKEAAGGNPLSITTTEASRIHQIDESVLLAPNRVLAQFKGYLGNSYFPATCLGIMGRDSTRLKIRFDDGTTIGIDPKHVAKLDLRVGDVVKIDLEKMRKEYVIRGFEDKEHLAADSTTRPRRGSGTSQDNGPFPLSDIRGFHTVLLALKKRQSMGDQRNTEAEKIVKAPVTSTYITPSMWSHFSSRRFLYTGPDPEDTSGALTPQEVPSTPQTPPSRTRRMPKSLSNPTDLSAPALMLVRPGSGLFEKMAFAVSYVSMEDDEDYERNRVTELIKTHGGSLLKDSFEELFQLQDPEVLSPTKSGRSITTNPFHLTNDAESVSFACVIANIHSRKKKYMQALALGLPCLSGRWIIDSVTKESIQPWEPYLLPAGESSFLGGVVRSRVLSPFDIPSARLATTLLARPNMLQDASVLLVMGKGRAEELRRAYLFLTHAMGAGRVGRALNVQAAKKAVDDGGSWDWVFTDGKPSQVEEARKLIVGNDGARKEVKVVGDEFVIQTLILGKLLDV